MQGSHQEFLVLEGKHEVLVRLQYVLLAVLIVLWDQILETDFLLRNLSAILSHFLAVHFLLDQEPSLSFDQKLRLQLLLHIPRSPSNGVYSSQIEVVGSLHSLGVDRGQSQDVDGNEAKQEKNGESDQK